LRVQKALADAGIASRRKAEEMVAAGRVQVNGAPAAIGQVVDPSRDVIAVDGRTIATGRPKSLYLVMNKPVGVTSTVSDPHAKTTVIDLVPAEMRPAGARIYPVGRLDSDSEGLLLLTNDGTWAQRMLHPSHGIEREYAVGIDRPLDDQQADQLRLGIRFEEGHASISHLARATSADVRRLQGLVGRHARDLVWYRATLQQGMKRQIRRMFRAVGVPVRRLVRVRFGTIRIGDMATGEVRPLTSGERKQLAALVSDSGEEA
jgi:23S rRNA pseudouridine2605 synthase